MRLHAYLRNQKQSQHRFARRVRTSQRTISRICRGEVNPSVRIAEAIVRATGGMVRHEDLIPAGKP